MSLKEITRIATAYRRELEDYYDWADNPHAFVGACRSASLELAERLRGEGFPAEAHFGTYNGIGEGYADIVSSQTGEPCQDSEDGSWLHWYVVCDGHIVDVTGDQFHPDDPDHPTVTVTPVGDERYEAPPPSTGMRR